LLLVLQAVDYINFAVDDVFITLRVSQNAANGLGLVYNAGEYVEGYSNFLWTLLLAGIAKVFNTSFDRPYDLMWIAKGLSFAAGLVTIFLLYRLAKQRMRSSFFATLTLLALIATGPFVLWMCGGLEGTFYAMLLTASILMIERYRESGKTTYFTYLAGLLFLASITRPEVLMHSLAMLAVIYFSVDRGDRKALLIKTIAPYAVLMACFFAWRWITYHDILPNTFYAKTTGGLKSYLLGLKYLLAGLMFIAGPFILAIPLTIARGVKSDITVRVSLALVASTAFFVAYSSGDWMAGYRFIMPLAPLLLLFGMEAIKSFAGKFDLSNRTSMVTLAIVTLVIASGMVFAARQMIRGTIQTMPTGYSVVTGHSTPWHEDIGNWFRDSTDGRGTIATGEAGMIAYLNPNMRVIDLYGLLDRYIAHTKKQKLPLDPNYLFDQKPDFILLYGHGAEATIVSESHNSSDYTEIIRSSPRFAAEYQFRKHFTALDLFERKK
jgi:arabinofuranosyltransferase